MIMVQSLRLRGLVASSLLAFAACSGGPAENDPPSVGDNGQPLATPATPTEIGGQNPQDPGVQRDTRGLIGKTIEEARRNLDLRLFEDARNLAAFVLSLDPANVEARDIVTRCNTVLGDVPRATERSSFTEVVQIDAIKRERERNQVETDLRLGDALLADGRFDQAIEQFEKARLTATYSMYMQPNDPLRKMTETRYQQALEARSKAEQRTQEEQAARSRQELAGLAAVNRYRAREKAKLYLGQANTAFMERRYEAAIDSLDEALVILAESSQASSNELVADRGEEDEKLKQWARELRELADSARHASAVESHRDRAREEWHTTFNELRQSSVPQTDTVVFDFERWQEVLKRKPAEFASVAKTESPGDAEVRRILQRRTSVEISRASLQDWAAYFQNMTNVTFLVSQEATDLGEEKTTLTDFRVPAGTIEEALKAVELVTGVVARVRNGMVYLVTEQTAISLDDLVLQPYVVGDLIKKINGKPGPNLRIPSANDDGPTFQAEIENEKPTLFDETKLGELIKTTIRPAKFEDSTFDVKTVEQQGTLYVLADRAAQAEVAKFLADLRRHVGIQIDIETRFLKVEDSFLEDVGIDLRGLGNQASQGVSGRGLEKLGDRQNTGFDDFGPRNTSNPAAPGTIGTGTTPGIFFDDGGDGDAMARVENLYNQTLGGRSRVLANQTGLTNAGGLSLQYAFLDDTEVEVVLRAVSKKERSEQIDAPRLLVYNNTRAHMLSLRQQAYIRDFEVEIAQGASVAAPRIGIVQDGVALDVRPVVDSELRFITMDVRPTLIELQEPIPTYTTTLGVGQPVSIQLPQVTRQTVRTTLTTPDGGTVMLGGMRLVERQNLKSTVPLLGSLPGLSWLFTSQGQSVQNRKVLILITSRIVLMSESEPDKRLLQAGIR